MNADVIIALIDLLLRVGPKAYVQLVKQLPDEPTLDEIEALRITHEDSFIPRKQP